MDYYLIRSIEACITPPGLMIIMMFFGVLFARYYYQFGRSMVLGGFFLLLATSLPVTNTGLYFLLETDAPLPRSSFDKSDAEAIVILGGGRYSGEEYGTETTSTQTLERLRYGSFLQEKTGLPLLVTGGNPKGEASSEADLMQQTLISTFKNRAAWLEEKSRNTWENAQFSAEFLLNEGKTRIYLVTHAYHMNRSKKAFQQAGFDVIPAPLGFRSKEPVSLLSFLPNASAMYHSKIALHELIGQIWYTLRY
ncbi:MAG: YdcF family protein [Gammaproteobacteria bacterium]|nr:YdcF family protein [Gammaproteobacteria bacterium]MDH5778568.1 YdcF family protein [Gammaproteobacteria bacterium]